MHGSHPEIEAFQLGEAVVASSQRTILVNGRKSRVDYKTMRVLLALTRRAGEVVTKDEILTAVWEDRFVGDEVVTVAISQLRKALGDSPREPRFIETVPRVGYRLLPAPEAIHREPEGEGRDSGERTGPVLHGPRRSWRRYVAGTAALLVALSLGWVWLQQRSPPERIPISVERPENVSGHSELDRLAADIGDGMLAMLTRDPTARAFDATAMGDEVSEVGYRLSGSLSSDPSGLRLDLRAVDLRTREVIWMNRLVGPDAEALVERFGPSFRKGALPKMTSPGG